MKINNVEQSLFALVDHEGVMVEQRTEGDLIFTQPCIFVSKEEAETFLSQLLNECKVVEVELCEKTTLVGG